jgi:hypothetical protein
MVPLGTLFAVTAVKADVPITFVAGTALSADQLNTTFVHLDASITAVDTRVTAVDTRVTAADTNIAAIDARVGAFEPRVAALEPVPEDVQESVVDTVETGTVNNDLVYQAASVSLTPGTWLVQAFASLISLDNPDNVQLALYDSTNGVVIPNSKSAVATVASQVVNLSTSRVCGPLLPRSWSG